MNADFLEANQVQRIQMEIIQISELLVVFSLLPSNREKMSGISWRRRRLSYIYTKASPLCGNSLYRINLHSHIDISFGRHFRQ